MPRERLAAARSLIAVNLVGDAGFLQTLPATRHLGVGRDGGVVVWLDDAEGEGPVLDPVRPDRPPEVELNGEGALPRALLDHPRAQYVEAAFDGLGDPVAAPLGWWHVRVWLKPA
ncbi:hypothetical protein [Caulobacter segnis]